MKELSDLYPKPKTYSQLKAEREQAQLARRPKFVALKIALWLTSVIFTVLVSYSLITFIMNNPLSSAGAVIAGTSFSFLVCLVGMAVLLYLYTLIKGTIEKTPFPSTIAYMILAGLLVVSGLLLQRLTQNQMNNLPAAFLSLSFNFVATYLVISKLIKHR